VRRCCRLTDALLRSRHALGGVMWRDAACVLTVLAAGLFLVTVMPLIVLGLNVWPAPDDYANWNTVARNGSAPGCATPPGRGDCSLRCSLEWSTPTRSCISGWLY
jgi:hypothetical protein